MLDKLIAVISDTATLTEADKVLCQKYFEAQSISKNTILEEQNIVPKYLYFVVSGYMRLFYYNEDGDEITTYLSAENSFIASFLSLIHQKPAKENVECVTDCEVIRILRTDLLQLIEASENFKKFSLTIFEHAIASTEIRANDLATLNAEQRYKKILSSYPAILQHIPIQYIASFLGIKPESLSRIRKQLTNVK
jgi:CRP/FNR family transcriptional regulator, anaerobic regulatory protein